MQTIRSSKAAIAGATLVFAFLAAVTLTLAPGAAHAQSLQVQATSTMNINSGGITVNYTGAGCVVAAGAWSCPNWSIFGGAIPNGVMLGTVSLFTLGLHLQFASLMMDFPSGCSFGLGARLLNLSNGHYGFSGTVGAYTLTNCSAAETGIIVSTIGTSPSSAPVTAAWLINHV